MNNLTAWLGQWEIEIKENGKIKETVPLKHNLITDAGLNMLRDMLSGVINDAQIKYVALGNNATVPINTDIKLGAEQFRKIVTSRNNDPVQAGKLYTELYIADTEANSFKCEEIGWFAGGGANATKDSGICMARILYSRQKSSTESWTIRRTDTISRG
ncbi:hypothetical protein N4T77_18835 [Clostridium sp. CX1]|uniref:hypothetical protein n=1 Tax=Clostridium sp. CX1 TaxID=2978346 RepID=UPI0021C22074|nr:hypothetical protein [Clostridium sp. CX1]MCT8978649.1 hypothetical protein [Clostridium sp. CX1]